MKTLYVTNRLDLRAWLEKNHSSEGEVWLIYYKKHTGEPTISYEDAVEEAICFGWIDTTVRRLDDERYAQKFTPRRPKSKWNKRNIQRARKMIREGRMTESGLKIFNERREYEEIVETLEIPPDLKKALKEDKLAWKNFNSFAPSYRRMYIYYITSAKRDETRKKRIYQVVKQSKENKKVKLNSF
jgi:uncharacterized protein YdeI (YjbR/CyaY-like superfamily)